MQHAMGYVLAAVIGLALGILGGGGSILTIPIFVYVMGYSPTVAIAMSYPVVGGTSLVGAAGHWRGGNFSLRLGLIFGVVAMTGAYVSARLATGVPGVVRLTLLGVVMLLAAVMMLRPPPAAVAGSSEGSRPHHPVLVGATGLGVGALTGLVGIGGGFLFVPALVLLAGLPMKTAVGTSLLVIAMNTAAALAGNHTDIPWGVVAAFTAIAIAGSLTGARIVRLVPQRSLRRAFAYFLFVMAAFILIQNRAVLMHPSSALKPSATGVPVR